jgi:hypothetical protein
METSIWLIIIGAALLVVSTLIRAYCHYSQYWRHK